MTAPDEFYASRIRGHQETIQEMLDDEALMGSLVEAGLMMEECFRAGGRLLVCGNGGSAADSQHIATEFVSRFLLERPAISAEALTTNASSLTAIGNDYGFDQVFSRQVEAQGRDGDVLMGLSTSGNSKNVVLAMELARELGIKTIGLSGARRGTRIEDVSDVLIAIPSSHTPRIQEGHILVGHLLCEYAEEAIFGESSGQTGQ